MYAQFHAKKVPHSVPHAWHKHNLSCNSTQFGENRFVWSQKIAQEAQVQNRQLTNKYHCKCWSCSSTKLDLSVNNVYELVCGCVAVLPVCILCARVSDCVLVAVRCNYLVSQGDNDK